jgi:hypothetical protein
VVRADCRRCAADHGRDDDRDIVPLPGAAEGLATRDMHGFEGVATQVPPCSMSRVPAPQNDPLCEECGDEFSWSGKGPRPRHCGTRCRKRAERRRLRKGEEASP